MLINFLKRWGPALMFVVVLGLSVGLVFLYMDNPREATDVKVALDNKTKLEAALKKGVVSPEYIASPDQVAKIKTTETLTKNLERINSVNLDSLGVYVSYPQPVRPKSEQPPPPIGQDDIVAKMPYLAGESCKAEATRGKVYFKCDLPSAANNAYVMMEPIRIEVFRGLAANKIDTTKPWGTIELTPEVPPAPKATAGNAAPVVAPVVENSRRQPGGSGTAATATDRNKKPVPEEPLDPVVRVYRDTKEITLLTEYFYAARLVSKFTSVDGKKEPSKDATGNPTVITHHKPSDKNLTELKSVNPGVQLYGSPIVPLPPTGVTPSAITPTNFQLRLYAINGTVPPLGTIRNPAAHDNPTLSVNFEIYVWIGEISEWKTVLIQNVKEGDMLSGKVVYTVGSEKKEYDFTKDLGFKLFEVNMEELDSTVVKGKKDLKEVALVRNVKIEEQKRKLDLNPKTKAEAAKLNDIERFMKSGKLPIEKETVLGYEKNIKAQEREYKKLLDAPAAAPGTPPATGAATPAPASGSTNVAPPRVRN